MGLTIKEIENARPRANSFKLADGRGLCLLQPTSGERRFKQRWITRANARALVTSIIRQGVFGSQRWSYWKLLATAATRDRHFFGTAMTLAVMGYHFQVITRKLSGAQRVAGSDPVRKRNLPGEAAAQR